MGFVRIICSAPGRWRAGVQHPARKVYPADAFDERQLDLLRADPAITVELADSEEEIAEPEVAKVPLSSAELPTPRRIIGGVVRLFLPPDVAEPLLVEMTSMTHAALDARMSPEAFRDQVNELFARYARADDDEIPGEGRFDAGSTDADREVLERAVANLADGDVPILPRSMASEFVLVAAADATGSAQPAAAGDTEGAPTDAGLNPAQPSEGAEPEAVLPAASGTAAPADAPKTTPRKTATPKTKGKA